MMYHLAGRYQQITQRYDTQVAKLWHTKQDLDSGTHFGHNL